MTDDEQRIGMDSHDRDIEYGLIAALVAVAIIIALTATGGEELDDLLNGLQSKPDPGSKPDDV